MLIPSNIDNLGAEFIHNIKEHSWGQGAFRLFDPDYHIVEVGEPIEIVIKRYLIQGLSEGEVAAKTSMPIEEILGNSKRVDLFPWSFSTVTVPTPCAAIRSIALTTTIAPVLSKTRSPTLNGGAGVIG
ncbi:MAG: hypothetical protein JXA46_06190 [Dehalococcoidales bacterium]|nr:hypothetical protein [Dehalococcoidales bacterium]